MPFIYLDSTNPGTLDALSPIPAPPLSSVYGVSKYLSPWGLRATNTITSGLGHYPWPGVYYVPIKVDTTSTYDRVAIGLIDSSSIGGETFTYDLGLYDDNNEYPGDKLATFGSIAITSSTAAGNQLITINQQLTANNLYWLAIGITRTNFVGAPLLPTPAMSILVGDFANYRKSGSYSPASGGTTGIAWMEQFASYSGTLPTSAEATWQDGSQAVAHIPMIGLRRSA